MATATWLMRGGEVMAAAEIADTAMSRMRGLLGRSSYDGALFLPRTRSVHTVGMRFAIDVAFIDADMVVADMVSLQPWRVTRPRWGCRSVLEAELGAFERWGMQRGDQLELRRVP